MGLSSALGWLRPFEKNTPEEGRRTDRPKRRVNNTKTKKEKNSPQNFHNNQEPSQNYRKYIMYSNL